MDKDNESSPQDRPHISVMTQEVLEHLTIRPGGLYLDVTFGAGGHSRAILERDSTCRVVAIDWDKEALEEHSAPLLQEFPDRFSTIWGSFAQLYKLAKREKISSVDGILADFGTSQIQITDRAGFSLYRDTPLDMRMSPSHQRVTAEILVNEASDDELAEIFFEYGEERYSRRIARAIVEARALKKVTSTMQLAAIVKHAVPRDKKKTIHPATRVFQALRIYVNRELDNIHAFLPVAFGLLAPKGRLVCISFHSLEDRIVKNFFRECEAKGVGSLITKKVVVPSEDEIKANSSSRSAKLRSIEKVI